MDEMRMENGLWRDGEIISTGVWDMSNSTFWQLRNNDTNALVLTSEPLPTPAIMTESFKVVESEGETFHNFLATPDWHGSYAMDMFDTGSGLMQMITVDGITLGCFMNFTESNFTANFTNFIDKSDLISVPITSRSKDVGVWRTLQDDPEVQIQASVR